MESDQNERYPIDMSSKQLDLGPTGQTVAKNVKRLRTARNLTYAEMSRRLTERGQAIPELGLRRIENEQRKVDVDDLIALAHVLNTTPDMLLMPEAPSENTPAETTSLGAINALELWNWLKDGDIPNAQPDPFNSVLSAPPFAKTIISNVGDNDALWRFLNRAGTKPHISPEVSNNGND